MLAYRNALDILFLYCLGQFGSKMFRVPITIHSPEIIYEYLEKRLGPLHMLIKKGQALITFVKEEDNARAANEIKDVMLKGHPLRLLPYVEGELDKKIETMDIEPAVVEKPIVQARATPTHQVSPSTMMIDEALQIKDEKDKLQKIIKTHKKKVVDYICNLKTIYNAAKSREKDYAALPSSEREKKMQQLESFTASQLSDTKNKIQTSYKRVRSNINKFGKQKEQIDLDPSLQIGEMRDQGSIPMVSRFEQHIHYINNNSYKNSECGLAVKRIVAFNDKEFICSNQFIKEKNNIKGRIRVYGLQNEYEVMGINLNEGCYGLNILEKYLLIGNLEGSISFWNSSQGDFSSQQSFQVSEKIHSGSIFDIIRNGNTSSGYSLLTLGMDFSIKNLWVTEDLITDDIKTLFFKQMGNYSYYPNNCSTAKEIMSMDLLEQDKKIMAASWNKVLNIDLNNLMLSSQINLKSNIFKIRKINPNLVCASSINSVYFLDPRTHKKDTNFCHVPGEIKTLCPINDTILCYGSGTGEIGLIDSRSFATPFWSDVVNHQSRIYDIIKMGSKVISGDQSGSLIGWNIV